MEEIVFENHFGIQNNEINSATRNIATDELVFIITKISQSLDPNSNIEVLFLPSEFGSYKDILKVVGGTTATLTLIAYCSFEYLNYIDSHQEHNYNEKILELDLNSKCLKFQEQLFNYQNQNININGISNDQIADICGDVRLMKSKNRFYETLSKDIKLDDNEIILKKNNKPIRRNKIPKNEFRKYIGYIPGNEEIFKENIEGVIEIIAPVLQQKKEGKGQLWSGIYYGEDIKYRGVEILLSGEHIKFYMQDQDFKEGIYGHKIVFGNGDNISVSFNIKCNIDIDIMKNRNIYVKEVRKRNEDIIEHKKKIIQKSTKNNDSIMTLF